MSAPPDTPMRLTPLPAKEWGPEVASILEFRPEGAPSRIGDANIFSTLARHPQLFGAAIPLASYLLIDGELPVRDRELLILRTAVRCGCSYEWGQHERLARALGIDPQTIGRVLDGPAAHGWSEHESRLLAAVDELHDTTTISEPTWESLARSYDERQMIEMIVLIGQYHLLAFALNAIGVELDDGLNPLPPGF